jgi:sugar phosphate isomerase/epimerase
MKVRLLFSIGILLGLCLTGSINAADEAQDSVGVKTPKNIKRPFFAFDNGMRQVRAFDDKAALLKELGYDGVGWRIGVQPAKMIAALDKHGLKMISTYAHGKVDAKNPSLDKRIFEEMKVVKKHKTIIWLNLAKGEGATDEIAVKLINQLADKAQEAGLKVVLYPHVTCYTETVEDVLRLAEKVNRPNVGMSFNLCHFLKTDSEKNLKKVLRDAGDRLMLVSINGADSGDTKDWKRLILPLGDGTFDIKRVMNLLDEIEYTGPVGLQCYNIKGNDRENLKKSIAAWRSLNE